MPRYHTLGKIPSKRHTTFKKSDGSLYQEELFGGTAQFSGMSSLIYHLHPPTVVNEIRKRKNVTPQISIEKNMQALSFNGFSIKAEKDFLESRKAIRQ